MPGAVVLLHEAHPVLTEAADRHSKSFAPAPGKRASWSTPAAPGGGPALGAREMGIPYNEAIDNRWERLGDMEGEDTC